MLGTGIVKGMAITLKNLFSKTKTEYYPYEKKTLPSRSRIFLTHKRKEDGTPACIACGLCARSCPDSVLKIEAHPEDRKKPMIYDWYMGRCTFCGLCVEACPYDAIGFTQDFEKATGSHWSLIKKLIADGEITEEGEFSG